MGIKVRLITDDDMVEVSNWFTGRNWKLPPVGQTLPESGYVAVEKGRLMAVAWLYVTNSGVAILDWVATHPDAGSRGIFAVKKLVDHIEEISTDYVKSLVYFTPNDKLAGFLKKRCGFQVTEKANVCVKRRAEA